MSRPFKTCSCRGPRKPDGRPGPLLGQHCPQLWIEGKGGKRRYNPNHGRWYVRYEVKTGGQRRRPRLGGFDTREEAIAAYEAKRESINRHGPRVVQDAGWTMGEHLDWMLAHHDPYRTDPYHRAETAVNLYLRPGLGHLRVSELTSDHVHDLIAAMRLLNDRGEDGDDPMMARLLAARATWHGQRLSTRPLTDVTIKRHLGPLVRALNHRRVRHLLPAGNPAAGLELEPTRIRPEQWTPDAVAAWKLTGRQPSKVMVWTPEHTGAFLDAMSDPERAGQSNLRLYPLWHLAAYTGRRRSELLGLVRTDVDLVKRRISIRRSKTKHGIRTLTIDQRTADVLSGWFAQQMGEQLAAGPAWSDTGLVFTDELGRPLSPPAITKRFSRAVRRLGLPPVRFHDLRHFVPTMLLASGVPPNVVRKIMGHHSAAFTMDVYAAWLPEQDEQAAEAILAAIPRGAG